MKKENMGIKTLICLKVFRHLNNTKIQSYLIVSKVGCFRVLPLFAKHKLKESNTRRESEQRKNTPSSNTTHNPNPNPDPDPDPYRDPPGDVVSHNLLFLRFKILKQMLHEPICTSTKNLPWCCSRSWKPAGSGECSWRPPCEWTGAIFE